MKCRYHAAAVIVLLTFFILNSVVYDVSGADSSPGNLYALSAVLMDGDSGRVLYEKEGETPRPNASLNSFMDEILLGGMEMGMPSHYSMNGGWRIRNEK